MNAVRIVWNGMGGELDAVVVANADDYNAISAALVAMVQGNCVCPGDSFAVQRIID